MQVPTLVTFYGTLFLSVFQNQKTSDVMILKILLEYPVPLPAPGKQQLAYAWDAGLTACLCLHQVLASPATDKKLAASLMLLPAGNLLRLSESS